jgi:regulator of RNase E activity RraA
MQADVGAGLAAWKGSQMATNVKEGAPGVDALVQRLSKLDTCTVSDAMDRQSIEGPVIAQRPKCNCPRIAGRASTVKLVKADGRTSTRHLCTAAVESGGPGTVIVVDNEAREFPAGWGGILSQAAKVKGVEGVVVDGAVRDVDESRELAFPVYARYAVPITARGRIHEDDFNVPIQFGGVTVHPGDLVLADWSGITFIPAARAEEVLTTAETIADRESQMAADVRAGKSVVEVMGTNYENMAGKH